MNLELLKSLRPQARLLYWVTQRESIRRKRMLNLPPPWTEDPILSRYRFCNVRRMDDAVSTWLYENWYKPYRDHPNSLTAATLARHFNRVDTLEKLGRLIYWDGPPLLERIKLEVRDRKKAGHKVFSAAYMVRGIGNLDKTQMVVNRVVIPLCDNPPRLDTRSVRGCVTCLLPYWGFSNFMAGQVVADLRWALSGTWEDRHHWACSGPGSLRGLNRLAGRQPNDRTAEKRWADEFAEFLNDFKPLLPEDLKCRLEAVDYQNCLCEWDKWERVLWGEGRPKQLYKYTDQGVQ